MHESPAEEESEAHMAAKHVLILFTDQQRWDTIGALGNPHIQTPHLDALAGESQIFENCITPSPVCVPARLSMLAGQYPARTGCNNNNAQSDYRGEGYYAMLTQSGFQSCCVGKMHHLMDPYGPIGFDKRYTQEELSEPQDDYTKFIIAHYPWVFDYHGMRSEMYYVPQISPLPPCAHPTTWVGDHAVDYIRGCDAARPTLLMASFIHPHPPCAPPAPWQKLYREYAPPPLVPAEEDMPAFREMMGDRGSRARLMISDQDMLRQKNFYYACVSYVDYQVGRIVRSLKDKGMYEDTLILFTSDHGDMMGDYQAVGKRTMVDASCRVPFLLKIPGMTPARRSEVCSLVDVAPTVLAWAGVAYDPAEFDGIDLLGGAKHDFVFSQHGCGGNGLYMVTDGQRKLIYKAANDRYYYFDQIPERKDVFDPANPTVQRMRALLETYRASDVNKAAVSKTYESYTKIQPHAPGRMDHVMRRAQERAAIPPEYRIDLA